MLFATKRTKAFHSDMRTLSRLLLEMGRLAESQVARIIEALGTADHQTARFVVEQDAAIDSLQRTIDERAVDTIARCRPDGGDLRELLSMLRIASQLERIGDLAKNIGKRILAMSRDEELRSPAHRLKGLALAVLEQLQEVLDSLVRRDADKAVRVWARDEDVDRLCAVLSRELMLTMAQDPRIVTFGIHLLFCTKNLERMGDHATNIAEAVCYMIEGRRLGDRPKADVTSAVMT